MWQCAARLHNDAVMTRKGKQAAPRLPAALSELLNSGSQGHRTQDNYRYKPPPVPPWLKAKAELLHCFCLSETYHSGPRGP